MFHTISGKVAYTTDHSIALSLSAIGVAISLEMPRVTAKIGDTLTLFVHLHWHQEQGPTLFGFASFQERVLFRELIACTGIGPKMALEMLGHLGVDVLVRALQQGDITTLSSVSGIGKKKAEQLAVQLRHKIENLLLTGKLEIGGSGKHTVHMAEVLQSLNYSRTEIAQATEFVCQEYGGVELSFDEALRKALSFLAKKR